MKKKVKDLEQRHKQLLEGTKVRVKARVPSICMRNNKKSFEEHDKERFKEYLEEVRQGKKKIASGALKPHQLVQQAMRQVG